MATAPRKPAAAKVAEEVKEDVKVEAAPAAEETKAPETVVVSDTDTDVTDLNDEPVADAPAEKVQAQEEEPVIDEHPSANPNALTWVNE